MIHDEAKSFSFQKLIKYVQNNKSKTKVKFGVTCACGNYSSHVNMNAKHLMSEQISKAIANLRGINFTSICVAMVWSQVVWHIPVLLTGWSYEICCCPAFSSDNLEFVEPSCQMPTLILSELSRESSPKKKHQKKHSQNDKVAERMAMAWLKPWQTFCRSGAMRLRTLPSTSDASACRGRVAVPEVPQVPQPQGRLSVIP